MANDNAVTLRAADAAIIGWEKCFEKIVFGTKITLCIAVAVVDKKVQFIITLQIGSIKKVWTIPVGGNCCIDIGYGIVSVSICVSDWQISSNSISFTLTLKATAFGITIFSFSQKITIPLSQHNDFDSLFASVNSIEGFISLLGLLAELEGDAEGADAVVANYKCYNGADCSGKFMANVPDCRRCRQQGGASIKDANGGCANCPK